MLLKGGAYKFVRYGVTNFELLLAKSTNDFLPVLVVILQLKIVQFSLTSFDLIEVVSGF
jgi:hypothetical protein